PVERALEDGEEQDAEECHADPVAAAGPAAAQREGERQQQQEAEAEAERRQRHRVGGGNREARGRRVGAAEGAREDRREAAETPAGPALPLPLHRPRLLLAPPCASAISGRSGRQAITWVVIKCGGQPAGAGQS